MHHFKYNECHPDRNATKEHIKTSGLAIALLVLSILGIHLLGLIFGIIALKKIKRSGGSLRGSGLALTGVIVSSVGLVVLISLVALGRQLYIRKIEDAQVWVTKANIVVLHNAVMQFKMDTGRYPEEAEGLNALVEQPNDIAGWQPGGYIEYTKLPRDEWGGEFIYYLNPENGRPFVIMSLGADGEEGGEGFGMDLLSTEQY